LEKEGQQAQNIAPTPQRTKGFSLVRETFQHARRATEVRKDKRQQNKSIKVY
jgi:hypothetical protein